MRSFVLSMTLLSLLGTAASEGEAVELTTDREVYFYHHRQVEILFRNSGEMPVYLASDPAYLIEQDGSRVFSPGGTTLVREVAPGETVTAHWDFRTNCFWQKGILANPSCVGIALPSTYQVIWEYAPTPYFPGLLRISTTVQIGVEGVP